MTLQEKLLYHQIHPLKLLTDFSTSFTSVGLLWQGRWLDAGLVALLPSVVVTMGLLQFAKLDCYRDSVFGKYLARHMSRKIEAARFAGQFIAWGGAMAHVPWLVPFGYFVIVLAWLNGLWARAEA